MPVQFLSAEWTQELEKRLNASEAFKTASASADVTIQNVINTPDGTKRYWMRFESGSVKLEAGDAEEADATIEPDYATAAATAIEAKAPDPVDTDWKIRINGSMMLLMQLQGALSELAKEMQEIDVDY